MHNPDNSKSNKENAGNDTVNMAIKREDLILYVFSFLLMVFLGGYFFYLTNLYEKDVQNPSDLALIDNLLINGNEVDNAEMAYIKAQLLLVQTRYKLFHKLARTKTHIKYVGFLIGALLTILGTIVVIRGVRDSGNEVHVEGFEKAKVKFTTSSPGIFVAAIGGAIILSTILSGELAEVNDGPLFFPGSGNYLEPAITEPIYGNDFPDSIRDEAIVPVIYTPIQNDSDTTTFD